MSILCGSHTSYVTDLANDVDVLLPLLQIRKGRVNLSSCALEGKNAIVTQNVVEITLVPHTWGRHGLDQVKAGKEYNAAALSGTVSALNTAHDLVDFVVEVIKHLGCWDISRALSLPGIHHQPLGSVLSRKSAHLNTMMGRRKTLLPVCIADYQTVSY